MRIDCKIHPNKKEKTILIMNFVLHVFAVTIFLCSWARLSIIRTLTLL